MIIGPVRCGTLRALCLRQAKAKRTNLSRVKIGVEEVHRQTIRLPSSGALTAPDGQLSQ